MLNLSVNDKNIIVLYHASCTDGFGSAYVAWKKFGDTASYIPRDRKDPSLPAHFFKDKEVYVLDYSFTKEEMLAYQKEATCFMVIDHHISAKENIEALASYIFDVAHSGAYLSWKFFHPESPIPQLIEYISDSDTGNRSMPDWEAIEAFIYSDTENHFTFEHYEKLEKDLESDEGRSRAKEVGAILLSNLNQKVRHYAEVAELIMFEGFEIYATNAPSEIKTKLGHFLALKTNSFALIFTYEKGFWKCSLRSVSHFDVSGIAEKYGGGGNKNSSAFLLKTGFPLSLARLP